MSTRALYRTLVPAHAGVSDDLVDTMLASTVASLSSTVHGSRYGEAVIWLTAHRIQRLPGSGTGHGAAEVGAVTAQSDSQSTTQVGSSALSRGYAAPLARDPDEAELQTTVYGQEYLRIRRSRKATLPFVVRA